MKLYMNFLKFLQIKQLTRAGHVNWQLIRAYMQQGRAVHPPVVSIAHDLLIGKIFSKKKKKTVIK